MTFVKIVRKPNIGEIIYMRNYPPMDIGVLQIQGMIQLGACH